MNRWSIYDMVNHEVLGFFRKTDLSKDEPLELVEYITTSFKEDEEKILTLTSESYEARLLREFFEPCKRTFKGSEILLGKPRQSKMRDIEVSLVFFSIGGHGEFFAVLTPVAKEKEVEQK